MMDLEILKKQNNLTISDDGLVYVKPRGEFTYITYPLKDLSGCIMITPEEYVLLKAGYYKFNKELTKLVINEWES